MYEDLLKQALNIQHNNVMEIAKDEKDYAFTFVYPPSKVLYKLNDGDIKDVKLNSANLYFHIPYCTGKCNYCYFGCYPLSNAPKTKSSYVNNLISEIEMSAKKYGRVNIISIHFGGGTPTVLSEEELRSIFTAIWNNFNMDDCVEITCESSPETLTESKLKTLIELGVNRLNIGIQTLNDELLKSINRRHDSLQAVDAIKLAQKLGLTNINVDLMYGLKGQNLEDWEDTLNRIFELNLQSISTYRLRIHPKGKISEQAKFFSEEKMLRMYIRMLEMMDEHSYYQCSSHKFAIKEELVQKQIVNKRGIDKNTLIPFGMAAYGYIENMLFWNERKMDDYVNKIQDNQLPYSLGYQLDRMEEIAKSCVLGIHNIHGIDLKKFREKYQVELRDIYPDLITQLEKNNLIHYDDSFMKLSKLGMIFADEIATKFYSEKVKERLKEENCKYGIFFDEIIQ